MMHCVMCLCKTFNSYLHNITLPTASSVEEAQDAGDCASVSGRWRNASANVPTCLKNIPLLEKVAARVLFFTGLTVMREARSINKLFNRLAATAWRQ